jgi:hypothetical protein
MATSLQKRARIGVLPNRLGGEESDDSSDDEMPHLARQEARGGGPDNDGSENGSEGEPPDIDSAGESDEDGDLEFIQDLEGDDSEDDLPPLEWKEVVGPTQIDADDFEPGIDHPGPNHNYESNQIYESNPINHIHESNPINQIYESSPINQIYEYNPNQKYESNQTYESNPNQIYESKSNESITESFNSFYISHYYLSHFIIYLFS